MGIHIDLFKVDTSTGAHVTREGELCVKVSLPFKNPYPTQKIPELLLLHCHRFQSLGVWEAFPPFGHVGLKVSLEHWRN